MRHSASSGWTRCGFVAAIVILGSCSLTSQVPTYEESPLRFDFTPLIGYRTILSFPTGQNGQPATPNLVLSDRPSYGFAVGGRLNEEDLVEFRWARQNTRARLENSLTSTKVTLDQYQGDFTHEYILDNWPKSARPFVIGSVGATHIGGEATSFTRFSFGLGGGVKFYFTRHFGVRLQGEWLPVVLNPSVAFVCGGGCIVHIRATLASQGEFVAGPVFRF